MSRISRAIVGGEWVAILAASLIAGCTKEASQTAAAPAVWRLSSPTIDIGVAEGNETLELSGASSSIRLNDGRIVIANSGTNELRVFDNAGRFLKTIGRKGEGPGEFIGALQMIALSDTTFAVYDQQNQRLSRFDTAGGLVSEARVETRGDAFPLWVWLHDRSWIVGPADTAGRSGVIAFLDRMPGLPDGSYRFVHIATDGRIWSQQRDPNGSPPHPWEVFSSNGIALGRVELPAEVEVQQIGPDFILLRHWEEDDVEQIQLYTFQASGEGTRLPGRNEAMVTPASPGDTRGILATAIRNLVTAQEMYYADHAGYATDAAGLSWEIPEGTNLYLMEADKRGWVGLIVHRTQPILCGMAVGGSTPPGWAEGSPKCSR